ncbi:hypothetical protein CYMTET_5970 [Cymbomonas tetramitiformis]|uniref:Chromo domain-containing protein n=1 Tax=Cymbomonas tetramitiformis TaxID=36881 RepID=A0AAE0GYC9_9CHLO|nr:hypothetical protein CYMTET_5970 [Cymbomonas tetramitiformis]
MSRYKDPANEPQAPEAEYTADSPPMVFVDPDADSVPAPAPPAPPSLVPKVKMAPPREFKTGQDAEVWLDTVDRYFQFTYPGTGVESTPRVDQPEDATEASGRVESISEEVLSSLTLQFQQMDNPSEHIAQMQSQTAQLKSQKKLLLYKGKVYGQSTHILVDPGATSSFIDRQFAAQLGIAPTDSSSFSVGLAGGSQLPCTSYLPKATFSLGKYKDTEDFYIIDMKPFTVILGQDWLERRNPHIDFQTKNLTITRKHSSGSSIRTVLSRVEQTPDSDDLPEMELVSATTMRKHLRRIRSSGSAEEAVAYLFFLSEVDGELVFAASDTDTTMEDPEVTAARDQVREDFSDIFQEDLPAGHRPERFEANSWEDKLPLVEFAINNTVSASTGYSPFYLDSMAQPLSPHDLVITIPPEAPVPIQRAIRDHFDQYSAVHANAVDNISRAAEISQARFNKTHMPKQFAVGQKVLLRTEFIQWTGLTKAGRHFKQPYIGPFTISKVLSHGRAYELDFGNLDIRIHPVQPVSRLELYNDSIQAPLPLPQMITEEGQPLFEISHILSDKFTRGVKYYLVRYAGYGPEHDTWVKATELTNAADIIAAYEG